MADRRGKSSNAADIIQRRYFKGRPENIAVLEEERANAELARLILTLRTNAGLTQQALADLIGTSQPNIARLEDADYEGHSLGMLRRIASALRMRVELRFIPDDEAA